MNARMGAVVLLLVLLNGASCGGAAPPPATPAPEPAAPATAPPAATTPAEQPAESPSVEAPPPEPKEDPEASPRERLMRAHFKETELIRRAIIDGDPAGAANPARALTKSDAADLGKVSAKAKPYLKALQEAAARVGNSPDVPGTAAAAATIGVACGNCHRLGQGPKAVESATPTVAAGDVKARMKLHVWATDRLWEGLYVPSDAAWLAGVKALAGDTFPKELTKKGGVHARSAADRFQRWIADGETKKRPEDRAQLYAGLLETCAGCHQAMR